MLKEAALFIHLGDGFGDVVSPRLLGEFLSREARKKHSLGVGGTSLCRQLPHLNQHLAARNLCAAPRTSAAVTPSPGHDSKLASKVSANPEAPTKESKLSLTCVFKESLFGNTQNTRKTRSLPLALLLGINVSMEPHIAKQSWGPKL